MKSGRIICGCVSLAWLVAMMLTVGCQGQPGVSSEPALAEAERLKEAGQHDEAVVVVRQFLSNEPNSKRRSDALVLAGECEMTLGRYGQAQRDFQEAQIKPSNSAVSARAKFGMGQAAFARDQYGDAAKAYEAALKTSKNDIPAPKALYKLGLAYARNHNWVEGRRRLRQLTEEYGGSKEAEGAQDILSMSRDVFQVKCGSFGTAVGVDRQLLKLRAMGLAPVTVPITREGRTLKSVRVGAYATFAEARAACDRIRARGVSCFVFP